MSSLKSLVFGTLMENGTEIIEGGLAALESSGNFFNITKVVESTASAVQKSWPDFFIALGHLNQSEPGFVETNLTCLMTTIGNSGLELVDKFALAVSETASDASLAFSRGITKGFDDACFESTHLTLRKILLIIACLTVGLSLLAGCIAWKVVGDAQRAGNAHQGRRAAVPRMQRTISKKVSEAKETTPLLLDL
jgi:hypothetical protein